MNIASLSLATVRTIPMEALNQSFPLSRESGSRLKKLDARSPIVVEDKFHGYDGVHLTFPGA